MRALGYFGDVEGDEALPIPLAQIAAYWQARQPEIIAHLDRFGAVVPSSSPPLSIGESSPPAGQGRVHVRAYRRADGTQVREHGRGGH